MIMRWQVDLTSLRQRLAWIGMVLILASGGSVVVRNVTDTLHTIAHHEPSMVIALDRPNR
jgi:hypothetical protein